MLTIGDTIPEFALQAVVSEGERMEFAEITNESYANGYPHEEWARLRRQAARERSAMQALDLLPEDQLQDLAEDITQTGADVKLGKIGQIEVTSRPTALKRAIRNVIENGVKYGGGAHVTAVTVDGLARIVVEDSGPGIPDADLDKVFEPFMRLEGSRNLETGGVGLGLATAQSIVHTLGGEISLSNRDTGGLRVTIEVPLAKS